MLCVCALVFIPAYDWQLSTFHIIGVFNGQESMHSGLKKQTVNERYVKLAINKTMRILSNKMKPHPYCHE